MVLVETDCVLRQYRRAILQKKTNILWSNFGVLFL